MFDDTNLAFLRDGDISITSLPQYSRASNEQTEEVALTLALPTQKAQTTRNSDMKASQVFNSTLVSVSVSNRRSTTYVEVSVLHN